MAKYRVWEPDLTNETELIVEKGKWAEYEADSPEEAAKDLAQEMADSGDYPDHVGDTSFDVHVRDLDTFTLYAVNIFWEWDPIATSNAAREIAPEDDELVSSVAKDYGMVRH